MAADPSPLVLGIDVGGTKVAVAAIRDGEIVSRTERPTDTGSSEALLAGIEATVAQVEGDPVAVGAGIPSQIEWPSGRVLSSVNIPLEGVQVREELERRLGLPAFVDNDANCAALAEAHGLEGADIVMLTLGTGVGGGVVIEGQIFRGADGLGAELGHVVIDENGPPCPGTCPNRGCLEALCSGTALERDANQLAQDLPDSRLGRIAAGKERLRGKDVVEAARDGEEQALDLFDRLGRHLGVGIASLVNVFQPRHVVIGGGLGSAAELFLPRAEREASARALPKIWERVQVSTASRGPEAGVIGAGLLALQELPRSGDTAAPDRERDQGAE